MNKIFKYLLAVDRFTLGPMIFSLLSIIFITSFFLFYTDKLPSKLPLFYSLPWGENQLVNREQFLLLPATVILITLVNTFIASQIHPLHTILRRMLTLTTVIIDLVVVLGVIKIFSLFI